MYTDGKPSPLATQANYALPAHVLEQAEFIFSRGLWATALCGPAPGSATGCTSPAHAERHKVSSGGKSPIVYGWTDEPIKCLDDVPIDSGNLGIFCGPQLIAADLDGEDAVAWADSRPELSTPWMTRTGSGKGQHRYFRTDARKGMDLRPPGVENKITIASFGRQCVGPYALHSSGARYLPIGDWSGSVEDLPIFPRQALGYVCASRCARKGSQTVGLGGSPYEQPRHSEMEAWRLWNAAHRFLTPGMGYCLRKHRFGLYLAAIPPCHPNKKPYGANVEALQIARFGGAALLLRQADVVALMLASQWNQLAHDGSESRIGKPYPWSAKELKLKYISALVTCRVDMFGSQVCYQAPAAPAVNP